MTADTPTVVDDFFAALFSTNDNQLRQEPNSKKRVMDEYDEYNILSKRMSVESTKEPGQLIVDDNEKTCLETRMLIRNISTQANRKDVRDYFSTFGKVVEVVFKNKIAFVQFESAEACASAVKYEHGNILKGAILGKRYDI